MASTGEQQKQLAPPRWMQAIIAGFNIVANHIYLIVIPFTLDLLLWLGPRVRIKELMEPYILDITQRLAGSNSGVSAFSETVREMWQLILTEFNLLSLLRTYPVGVPSLLANSPSLETPLGAPILIEMTNAFQMALVWSGVVALGLFLGTLYYLQMARAVMGEHESNIWKSFLQTFLLTAALILLIAILSIPFMLLLSIISLISPVVSQVILILAGVMIAWMLLPLVFSAHGIFVYNQNALISVLTSVRMVRFLLPGVSMFLLASVLLLLGLDLIWSIPGEDSWMQAIGIAGHAFIATAVLAASFVYYRNGVQFMQEMLRHWASQQAKPAQTAQ